MKFFAASRKKLPLALFLAAGTLSPCVIFAEETTRDSYDVADGDALRKYLSEKYLPEGAEKETYRDNADLNITQDFRVDTTATETSEDADGNESSETTATGSIEVLATGSKILGGGRTISSSEVDLSVKGAGDIFFLDGVTLSVENVAFAGTTDETKKTGRVFTTGNSAAGTTRGKARPCSRSIRENSTAKNGFTKTRCLRAKRFCPTRRRGTLPKTTAKASCPCR